MPIEMDETRFAELVDDVFDEIPQQVIDELDNVVFVIENRPADGSLDLLGEYDGLALTERDDYGMVDLPDRIVLYRESLLDVVDDEQALVEQVHITLMHEIAHYFGIDEEKLHELGWG
ncbi:MULTISPECIES: metallopeptidase family protein [unclassified Pseudoclavibacter]|uniref:metallopeptidase family protein n=1 Tax=unclassified Pseudoclavibacter TaxID=2615177 RepID=UPI0013013F3E|nr:MULTISPECIES: metallopeptidase family protein [unclassified Pseudoclavibacter]KAB1645754.1 metallopeptidase family protein [Pseudoclavibacter sp. CFCC 14310]KAB1664337.1 metallopeptidase family protein [Pseudoclavibacter sp. CFCC 13611]